MSSLVNSASDSDEGLEPSLSHPKSKQSKKFNEMIHGHIELPYLCCRIINTPQFQRLRGLKQIGLCYQVYPTASHNRFEHCIGTSYLAGKYAKSLQQNQPELGISEKDILCLYIAGLCHDIGHGPFSHIWDRFMTHTIKDYSHEKMSVQLLDYLIKQNGLWELFESEGLDDFDLEFVKRCILGKPSAKSLIRRGYDKYFLYQIVSNDETKIDVDKFDYILRDCKHLNVKTAFDYEQVIENCLILSTPVDCASEADNCNANHRQTAMKIAYRKKISDNLEELFKGRFRLHQIACQHKVTKIVEEMALDALLAADSHFEVKGDNGVSYKLSTAHNDLSAFTKLTDTVFDLILSWGNGNEDSKELLSCIVKRDLYKFLGFIAEHPGGRAWEDFQTISSNIKLISNKINYGDGKLNPLNNAYFFQKSNPSEAFKIEFPSAQVVEKYLIVLKNPLPSNSSVLSDMKITMERLQNWSRVHRIDIQLE